METLAEMVHRSRSGVSVTEINIRTIKHASYHRLMFTDTHTWGRAWKINTVILFVLQILLLPWDLTKTFEPINIKKCVCVCSGVCVYECCSIAQFWKSMKRVDMNRRASNCHTHTFYWKGGGKAQSTWWNWSRLSDGDIKRSPYIRRDEPVSNIQKTTLQAFHRHLRVIDWRSTWPT